MAPIKDNLRPVQIFPMTVAVFLGINMFTIHHKLIGTAGQDMWISVIIGGIITYLYSLPLYYIARQYPGNDFPEITMRLLGKIFGRIVLVPLTVFFITYAGLGLRAFTQVVRVFLLDRTPTFAVILLMCIVVVFTINKGIFTICNMTDILFPVFLTALIIFMLFSVKNADISRMEPILHDNTAGLLKSIMPAVRSFAGYGVIAYILRYMSTMKKTFKWFTLGMSLSFFLITAAVIITLLNFGPEEIKTMVYPFLALSKTVELPNTLVERLEGFIVIIWIPISFITVTIFTFMSVRNVAEIFRITPENMKIVTYLFLPILLFIAMYASNSLETLEYLEYNMTLGTILASSLVPALLVITLVKRRRKSNA